MLKNGLYEQIINKIITKEINNSDLYTDVKSLDSGESSTVLTSYLSEIIHSSLNNVMDKKEDVVSQVSLVNKILETIKKETDNSDIDNLNIDDDVKQLLALYRKKDSILSVNDKIKIQRPITSLANSSLFTGAQNEPQMYNELKKEIISSDRIDMLVSFIKWSGLRLIIDELKSFTQSGKQLRIITTSYMGATDLKAIEELNKLPNTKIKVSYNTKITRLHAKSYMFYRDTSFTTAYVGSSNLSNVAVSSGLEWNLKITKKDMPETIDKINATFNSYWNSNEFEYYEESQQERLDKALKAEKYISNKGAGFNFDITPYSYQQEILDKLNAERKIRNHYKNLVVAATGTGKTVISAFDYKQFTRDNPKSPCRLLFVAHREEILEQSIYTFRGILKDNNFGELFVGNYKPSSMNYLFISIQTFNSQDFVGKASKDYYDYIVVDEFHHACAPSYRKLLEHYTPKILLGLTATPERMDGKQILPYFDNRIAAEIRLPEAIDRKLLCPFQYFGVTDSIDLDTLKWSRGGYDTKELSNIYTLSGVAAKRRADMIVSSLIKYVTDINDVKGLGFCVSKDHAKFMSKYFNDNGIKSINLDADSSDELRDNAKKMLVSGEITFIFVVDIYNEGVDIPEVNTVLFLRPTESLTVFLQQLGRGLRLCENKDCLTVLDFIGQANKKYNFEDKFSALLSNTENSMAKEVKEGFVSVPKGCYIQLEKKAQKIILDNITSSFGNKSGLISKIATFKEDTGLDLTLKNFAEFYHINLKVMYKKASFSRLCVLAGVKKDFTEPLEETMTKAFARFADIDSIRFIRFLLKILTIDKNIFSQGEQRMLQMFQFTLWQKSFEDCGFDSLFGCISEVKNNPVLCNELIELLKLQLDKIDFIDEPVDVGFDCPLDLYCTYSRDQILVAMDFLKPATVREGVKYLPDKKIDILFVTLNKSEKMYSPTTMYNDYSINESLFHWQSQSTTSEASATGLRYINHKKTENRILLFVRENKNDRNTGLAMPYTYLGLADYVSHDSSNPMNITWKLQKPIPARFISKTNKLVIM